MKTTSPAIAPTYTLDSPSTLENQNTPAPPTHHQLRALALNAVEVIHGIRPVEPLARFLTHEAYTRITLQRTLRLERNAVYADHRRIVPIPGRVITSMPHEFKIHAVVVMRAEDQSFSVIVRLEWIHNRWRASELTVL